MELIRLEFQSFRDFAETAWPGLGRDGLWAPPGAPLPEGIEQMRLEVGLAEGSPLLRGVVRVEPEEGTGRTFLRFLELDRPSRVLLERIEAKHGHPVTVGPPPPAGAPEPAPGAGLPPPAEVGPGRAEPRVAEGVPSRRPGPALGGTAEASKAATAAEAHTLEELADLLSRQDRHEALAETQRIPAVRPSAPPEPPAPPTSASPPEPEPVTPPEPGAVAADAGTVGADEDAVAPDPGTVAPEPMALAAEPAAVAAPEPLPPYLGGPEVTDPRRRVVVVRSPWLWLVVVVGLLFGAWELGRLLRGGGARVEPTAATTATSTVEEHVAGPAFDRVEGIDWESGEASTVVTVRVNGSIPRARWSTERVEGTAAREILTLRGVELVPEARSVEVGDGRVTRVRADLHRGSEGDSLQVVVDVAGPAVRLAGVDVRERALRLVFVAD